MSRSPPSCTSSTSTAARPSPRTIRNPTASWRSASARSQEFLRKRAHGRLHRRRVRLIPISTTQCSCRSCGPCFRNWFRVEVGGIENLLGGRADRRQPRKRAPVRRPDLGGRATILRPTTATCGCWPPIGMPMVGQAAPRAGHDGLHRGRLHRLLADGELAAVPGATRASASTGTATGCSASTRWIRLGGPARPGIVPCSIVGSEEIYPMIADVKLARLMGLPCFPGHPLFRQPVRSLMVPVAVEVAHRVRDAHRHHRLRRGGGRDVVTFGTTDQVRDHPADALPPAGKPSQHVLRRPFYPVLPGQRRRETLHFRRAWTSR